MEDPKAIKHIFQLISHFLQKRESCYLPGIGVFASIQHGAEEKNNQLIPPFSEIVLHPNERQSQHALIEEIAKAFHIEKEKAKNLWAKTLDYIKTNKEAKIPYIGKIKVNDKGSFVFIADPKPTFYALLEMPREHFENPEYDVDPLPKESNKLKRKTILYTLLIVVGILIVATFVYFYFYNPVWKNSLGIGNQNNPVKNSSLIQNEDSLKTANHNPKDSLAVAPEVKDMDYVRNHPKDSITFVVVYRQYSSQYKALRDGTQKVHWGYNVSVYSKDSSSYLVGYPYYSLPADTTEKAQHIQSIYNSETRLIFPEIQDYKKIPYKKE